MYDKIYANRANLAAVDHLGRALPTDKESGNKRPERIVALFYYLWLGYHGTQGPYDITNILEADPNAMHNPDSPAWPPKEHTPMLHWGEPMFGYYLSTDEWVLRRHVQMFIDAGIDVLFFDVTNGFTYRKAYLKLFAILSELKAKGFAAPQVAFYTAPAIRGCGTGNMMDLWEQLYEPGLYPELWFRWKGKPLIVCHDMRSLPDEIRDFFTWRKPTWCDPKEPNTWAWEGNPQKVAVDDCGNPEEIAVNVCRCACEPYTDEYAGMGSAAFGVNVMGRSWHNGAKDTRPNASHYGFMFEEQGEVAIKSDAPVAFLCQWNEWLVPFLTTKTNTLYGMPHWIRLQDEYNEEYSRDLEPMKGGYKDAYYLQMASFARRFKGLEQAKRSNGAKSIDISSDFSQWADVNPIYREYTGDVHPRDYRAYDAIGRYTNYTGRNEFSELRVSYDEKKLYFYAKCSERITDPTDEYWMNLFIKLPRSESPSWEGYQYRVAFAQGMCLMRSICGFEWETLTKLEWRCEGKELQLAIEYDDLGLTSAPDEFEFKWADNIASSDIMDFYQDGDCAPRGRINWVWYK